MMRETKKAVDLTWFQLQGFMGWAKRRAGRTVARFPQQLQSAIRSARFELASRGMVLTHNERRLLALRNRYAGRRAFVIGNGPSLRDTDVRKLRDEVTIGSNGIFLLFEETGFQPTFYTVEDRLVAEDRASTINHLTGMIKVFPMDLRGWLEPDEDTIYVNFLRQYPSFPHFSADFVRKVYFGGTVTFLNLQLAYYLGAREVYLIGVDHSYQPPAEVDDQEGNVILSRSEDVNHFDPNYFGPGFRWHDPKVDRMEQAYREAKDFFETHDGRIHNATVGGKLEVFPRVEYIQALGEM
jgi:hypothetical protein